ncbi:hypothetical protein BWQ96_02582 [Gracilariopsis chorda]|uniref:Uncharacterized protein n=1 Tax=Gracilariopsis chorda TaxID=448386 RepID=A0A2V3IZX3_9FLOR|nr:hypothetical protein BWQ96_02582 [Gracilariopsis chorda]|eukprot:PXF47603.1 hypothetical protein BWQ96_02582 [Gracilariopsis chorda]
MPNAHLSPAEAHCDVATELRQALKFARANKLVAEWLFASQQAPFHTTAHILHPSAFTQSHASVWTQTFDLLHSYPDSASPVPYLTATSSTTLYVPVQTLESLLLGYTFTAVISETELPIEAISEKTLRKGRFAYNPISKSLILYINFTEAVDSLISITNPLPCVRKMCCFIVPHRPTHPYVFPSTVISCMLFTGDQQYKHALNLNISSIIPVDHSGVTPNTNHPASADPSSSSESLRIDSSSWKHFLASRGPSGYVSGVWDQHAIQHLPRCVLDDLTLPPTSDRNSSFRTEHFYHPSTSWLPLHEVHLLMRMNLRRSLRPKGSVLFDMRSINSSRKPDLSNSEKPPSTPKDKDHAISETSIADYNFSWHLDSDQNATSDADDDVDDVERDMQNTSAILNMLEGSFTSFNAVRQVFDTSTSHRIKTEIYHVKSTTQRSRSEELHRYRQTAASVYYNTVLWHSKKYPSFNKQELDVSRWLFAVEMKSPTKETPKCRESRHGARVSSETSLSSSLPMSMEENTPFLGRPKKVA